jgi:hypothetical protein
MIYILAILILLFMALELPGLLARGSCREWLAAGTLLIMSMGYGIDSHLHRGILPNPNRIIYLAQPLAKSFNLLSEAGDDD